MNIEELKNKEITPLISYIIGMCYPLYREIQIRDQKYIVGGVNHNPNRINETLLARHFKEILTLISDESEKILLMSNQNSECNISSKKGFSILIDDMFKIWSLQFGQLKKMPNGFSTNPMIFLIYVLSFKQA